MITGGRRIRRGTPLLIIELVPGQSLVMIIVAAGAGLTVLPDRACRGDLNVPRQPTMGVQVGCTLNVHRTTVRRRPAGTRYRP